MKLLPKLVPITDWNQLPVVCTVHHVAQVFGCNFRTIDRACKNGTMQPEPMPSISRRAQPQRQHYQWSRAALEAYVTGGYLVFVRDGRAKGRQLFGSRAS